MKKIFFCFFAGLLFLSACTKTYTTAKPGEPKLYKKIYSAKPNDLYYALRWAFKAYGYPIAEEDLQNGVIKSRYVPVGANSHYIDVFRRKDFGLSGAYHQLEARLLPHGDKTTLQIGSRIQSIVANIHSTGREEAMLFEKVSDYLRSPNVQLTNQGIQD